jgi:Virus neck protein
MPLGSKNIYFNIFNNTAEQDLLHSLVIESIAAWGIEVTYIPRNIGKLDKLYTADDQSYFTIAIPVMVYIKSIDGFTGDNSFMSQWGAEIRDQVTFAVSRRVFEATITPITGQPRPNEGDLIFYPLNQKCFQIKYTDPFTMNYPLGTLPTYDVSCELFEYSNEIFNTGIDIIDSIQTNMSTNIFDYALTDERGNMLLTENNDYLTYIDMSLSDILNTGANEVIETEANNVIIWNVEDPYSENEWS